MEKLVQCADELHKKFHEQGFLLVENCLSNEDVDRLKNRMREMIDQFDTESHRNVFSTTKQQQNQKDSYFLDSSDKISFFFEEDAFDEEGQFKQERLRSVNKVGHALHDIDPTFCSITRGDLCRFIIEKVIGIDNPSFVQSMYIFKQPRIGGEVRPHRDNWFIHTDPLSCNGLWFALEDATEENGCLWAVPGSHKETPCEVRFIRKENDELGFDATPNLSDEGYVPLPVSKGSLVVIHGGVLHKSYPNRSQNSRQAYTFHVVDGNATYSSDNWLQRKQPFYGYDLPGYLQDSTSNEEQK